MFKSPLSLFLAHYTHFIFLIYLFTYHLLNDAVNTLESVAWNYGISVDWHGYGQEGP